MLRIDHTAYPDCRKHEEGNSVRPGGLWYSEEQNEFLKEARKAVESEPVKKRKDGVKEFAKWFWIVVIIIAIVLIGIYK